MHRVKGVSNGNVIVVKIHVETFLVFKPWMVAWFPLVRNDRFGDRLSFHNRKSLGQATREQCPHHY